jgi:hypothetical protein
LKFNLQYNLLKDLPKLAWLARVDRVSGIVSVIHGSCIECRDEWMVEGVWDNDFEQGNFHQSENFFGSGIRIDSDNIYITPSSAPIDRLLYCEDDGKILVSNSLLVLLASTDASLNYSHDYHQECLSVLEGVDKCSTKFRVSHPQIKCFHQRFYKNIIISKNRISFERRDKIHKIDSYDHYIGLLKDILLRLKSNYASDSRKIPVSAFSTMSTGYDSTAVSELVKHIGVNICYTGKGMDEPKYLRILRPNWLIKKRQFDQGDEIAKILGLKIRYLDNRRSSISQDELYFLSTNFPKYRWGTWSDLIFHSMTSYIEKNCSTAVVFTGHYGGTIWETDVDKWYLDDQIKLRTFFGTGFNLTEIRLKSGFFHIPVPYMLARNIKDIYKISYSKEMEPYRLHNSYDRPIPRRIVESAGVDRSFFGIRKKFIANELQMWPVNADLKKQFSKYLREEHNLNLSLLYFEFLFRIAYRTWGIGVLLRKFGLSLNGRKHFLLPKDINPGFLMWHWATSVLTKKLSLIICKKKE